MENQPQLSLAERQAALLAVCSQHNWASTFLSAQANSPQQLAQLYMKELAACRAAGRGELTVALVESATGLGLNDPRGNAQHGQAQGQQQGRGLWRWLAAFSGNFGGIGKRSTPALPGTPEQIEALMATCRAAGWSPSVLASESAAQDLLQALLSEMRACSDAGHHQLVVRLAHEASSLGIQHQRLRKARRQAQALLDSALFCLLETAIQLREQRQPAASLALLDTALAQGHSSPWIHDNRARALVDLGRRMEAIGLWEPLQSHRNPAVAQAAEQMLQLQRQQLLLPLHATLHQLASEHAWTLRHLGDPTSLDLGAYTTSLLKDTIEARENGHPDLSLALLDAALAAGLTNPWLHDNRARALVNLGRRAEAIAIWEPLQGHQDPAVAQAAQQMHQLQCRQLLLQLHDTFLKLANQHGWTLRHLGDPATLDLGPYTTSLLKEAIEARDKSHPELSLALLDAALAAGLANPWLLDNRARALVHRNQLPEAVDIWEQLCHDNDNTLRATAHDMVQRFAPEARRQALLAQADQLLQAGERDQAIQLLSNALLSDPQSQEIQSQLQQLKAEQAANDDRIKLLQEKTRHTAQQLDQLKDLLTRLMVNP